MVEFSGSRCCSKSRSTQKMRGNLEAFDKVCGLHYAISSCDGKKVRWCYHPLLMISFVVVLGAWGLGAPSGCLGLSLFEFLLAISKLWVCL